MLPENMALFIHLRGGVGRVQLAFTEKYSLYCDLHKDLVCNRFLEKCIKKKSSSSSYRSPYKTRRNMNTVSTSQQSPQQQHRHCVYSISGTRGETSQAEITLLVSLQYLLWHYEDVTLQRLACRSLLHKYNLWQFTATNNVSTWLRNKVYVRPPPPLPHNSPAEYSFSTPAAQIVARQPFSAALYFQPPDVVEAGKQSTHFQSFKKHTYLSE